MNENSEMLNKQNEQYKSTSNDHWLALIVFSLFLFFMTLISSLNIITSSFILIWFLSMVLTIILGFRFLDNLRLKDIKKIIKNNDTEIEIINSSCILIKEKNDFSIREKYFYHKIESLWGIMFILVITVPILILDILSQILTHSKVINYFSLILIILIFIIPFNIPFFISYLYYKNRITVCSIDKSSKVILLKKLLSKFKILRKMIFSEIKAFEYLNLDYTQSCYTLRFIDKNGLKIKVFDGEIEECIHIYSKISDFLGIKFENVGENQ